MEEVKQLTGENTSVKESLLQPEQISKTEAKENIPTDETPSRSKDLSKTLPEEAFNNFIQGKRHMLVQDYTFAVQSLATACELYVKHFGELALECGEVYFLYGKSLIRLSQQQTGVLGDAINKTATITNDDDDEEEGDSSDEGEGEKDNESESGEDNKDKETEKNGSAAEETETEEKEPSESTDSPQNVDNEVKDSKEMDCEQSVQETDVSVQNQSNAEESQEPEEDDLELAWNSLETAKSIFARQGENNKDAQLKIAEILQLLAEISMETDNYPAAINDLKSCLSIQEKHLLPDDRLLAHTYYEMGLAHMLQKMYDGALENFTKTMEIFELRRDNLKNTPVPETVGGFEAADRQKEIEDIESIITDIKEKIEDTKELVRNAKNEIQEAILQKGKEIELQNDFGKAEQSESSSRPISNITHLLKRKKPDEEEKESESKRIKICPSVPNGDTPVC